MRTGVFSLIFAVIAVGYLSSPAAARPAHDRHSLDQILPQIRQQHPGTLYDADGPFIGQDGREHYRLKWMTPDGRVQWLDADAHSGRVTNAPGRYDSFEDGRGGPDDRNFDRDDDQGRDSDRGNGKRRKNNDDDRRNRFDNDGGFGNPFANGNGGGNDDDRPRRNNDWNGNGNWDRGNHDNRGDRGNGGFGGWHNNDGGGHRHHGHD